MTKTRPLHVEKYAYERVKPIEKNRIRSEEYFGQLGSCQGKSPPLVLKGEGSATITIDSGLESWNKRAVYKVFIGKCNRNDL